MAHDKAETRSTPSPKKTPGILIAAAVAGAFVLNFLILGYSTKVALKPLPELTAPPVKAAGSADAVVEKIPAPVLLAQYQAAAPPLDPMDAAWEKAEELPIALGPQDVVIPFGGGSVSEVSIKALHDGDSIAFRLQWADATRDLGNTVDTFGDAVAVQFPMDGQAALPSALMGEAGKSVNIWQWRANWQFPAPETATAVDGTWYPPSSTLVANRFNSRPQGDSHCMEFVSEGWGTLTKKPDAPSRALGVHSGGTWSVVFQRAIGHQSGADAAFLLGEKTAINLAVWNGAENDVNGFKSVSKVWTEVLIQGLPEKGELLAKYVAGVIPTDSEDSFWDTLPAQPVALTPQKLVIPFGGGSVAKLEMRAVHNGEQIAFRLNWKDDSVDWENGVDTFKDAVALQFPVRAAAGLPSPLMGERDKPVAIWQWRSDWQADATGALDRLHRQPETLQVASATFVQLPALMPAWEGDAKSCVEFAAAGWGTLTTQERQNLTAFGNHSNGEWSVVFLHELQSSDPSDPEFIAGQTTQINFAAWNGSAQEVNGMKSVRMTWTPLTLEPSAR